MVENQINNNMENEMDTGLIMEGVYGDIWVLELRTMSLGCP